MKKSLMARIVTVYLKLKFKRRYNGRKEVAIKYFDNELCRGEKEYKLPKINFGCSLKKQTIDGMDVYVLNSESSANKTIYYFHGGGYVNQPLYFHWRFIKKLIKCTDAKIVFPIYPLAPFHTFRDIYDKMHILYCDNINTGDEIIFMGDSSGGGFAIAFYEYISANNLRVPTKVIALSPWLDVETDNPEIENYKHLDPMLVQDITKVWGRLWAGDETNNYMVSPVNFERCDLLQNISIFIGTDEILYPDAVKFFDKIKDNPFCELIVGKHMSHVYPLYPIPEAKVALKQIEHIIKR